MMTLKYSILHNINYRTIILISVIARSDILHSHRYNVFRLIS